MSGMCDIISARRRSVVLSWLTIGLLVALVSSSEAAEPGQSVMQEQGTARGATKGGEEVFELRKAVQRANHLIEAKANTPAIKSALQAVHTRTVRLEHVVGRVVDDKGKDNLVSPMASVHVDSRPKSPENEYPALGITLNTLQADGYDAPVSNTLEVWGSSVAKEREKMKQKISKDARATFSQYGDLESILSKHGNGRGFGQITTQSSILEQTPHDNEAELTSTIADATHLLDKSQKTLGIVKTAVNTVVQLSAEGEQANAESETHAHHVRQKGMLTLSQENAFWDRIRHMNTQFKKKHQLLEYSEDADNDTVNAAEEKMAQFRLHTPVSIVHSPENDPSSMQPEAAEQPAPIHHNGPELLERADRTVLEIDSHLKNQHSKEDSVGRELEKAKVKTMSIHEKIAAQNGNGDEQANVDMLEQKEIDHESDDPTEEAGS